MPNAETPTAPAAINAAAINAAAIDAFFNPAERWRLSAQPPARMNRVVFHGEAPQIEVRPVDTQLNSLPNRWGLPALFGLCSAGLVGWVARSRLARWRPQWSLVVIGGLWYAWLAPSSLGFVLIGAALLSLLGSSLAARRR